MTADGALWVAVPEYEFVFELGRGAMGIVHLARHRALDRTVAVKRVGALAGKRSPAPPTRLPTVPT